ncbi:hypothetical protein PVK06_043474 [Gossypium arboreum]|uniref:Uncharacterized protein n=1 Tax=Gossypium arboreum TaxID=29729 RepID=A0ABR0MNP0_GOSAR|nr:hypothetical protein PVK06_043474 [Gossypium arboreum]
MLSAVEVRVGKLEESMEAVKESDNARGESIEDIKDQFRDFVTTCLTSQRDNVQELLDSQRKKLTERNNALEAMKKPKKRRDKLKCFLCDGPHILKKCPMKSALRKKPVGKALGLGSSARGVEAKEAESEKKPVECFLCHGPHRLRKCPRKSVIEENDGADKEPKKLGSSKGKAEAKRAKRSKKKRVKCFLCRGPHELRNCPKQAVVKGKATSEHSESSEGLPPKGEVSLSSNLEEKVAMKTVKLGPMRLVSSEASELAESLTRLPPMGEVGGASDFKEKEVMHVGQLTRVNAKVHSKHSDSVLHSNLCTWRERRGPFEVLEQGGRETLGKVKPSVVNHEDSVRGKLECGQGSDITPCRRDVQTSKTARVKKRWKPRQKSQRKGRAKTTSGIQGESSQCHSGVATRTLREWVGENVTGQSSKPVTIEPNASDGGLLLRWGSFGPQNKEGSVEGRAFMIYVAGGDWLDLEVGQRQSTQRPEK